MTSSVTTQKRDPCRDRDESDFRHGGAGSDAGIALEEGGAVPGTG